jgi:hypothetical protein
MHLTTEEIARYAPYHTMLAFARGFYDYRDARNSSDAFKNIAGQAYGRGTECAMRRCRRSPCVSRTSS